MKKKLTKNLGMKILSLILASLLWVIIVNIDDPTATRTFRDISVNIQHEDAIYSLDKVYDVIEGNTVDVTVRAKRSVLDTMKVSDIRATADLSNLSYTNAVPIIVTCSKSVEQLTLGKVSTLKVSLEDTDTKQFKITVTQRGTEEEGYSVGSVKAKPNIIQVTGAKSQIAKIDQIRVDIDVSNASEDFTAKGTPVAYDANGRSISSANLVFSSNQITVYATIFKTKTIPLEVTTKGTPAAGYQLTRLEYEPKEVEIIGETKSLSGISSVPIVVDISGASANIEESIDISGYMPDKIMLTDDTKTVMVTVTIEKMQEKNLSFRTDDIDIKNLPTGATFKFNHEGNAEATFAGLSGDLSGVTLEAIHPYIDLKGLTDGTHQVEVSFVLPDGITVLSAPMLSITLNSEGSPSSDSTDESKITG